MKTLTASALLLFSIYLTCFAQDVLYPVRNYTTREYGTDFNPANSSVVQDRRGIIYAGNAFKLLEFDGSRWSSSPINSSKWILSLATGSSGFVFAGSQKEFGYFRPDEQGRLRYVSLSEKLPPEAGFTNIWKVAAVGDGVIFQAEERIFIYRNGSIKWINPETSFHTSFTVNGRFFVRERNQGLRELKDDSLVYVSGGHLFDTTGIFLMTPLGRGSNSILVGTVEKGFWVYNPGSETPFSRFNTEDDRLFSRAGISGGVMTGGGLIAVGTRSEGLVLMDTTGRIQSVINRNNGLIDNEVKDIITDQSGNLWLALNNGISTVEVSSPLSYYSHDSGLPGSVNCLIRHGGLLYAGTNAGLYCCRQGSRFEKEPGINAPVRALLKSGNSLLAGTDAGLYLYRGDAFILIDRNESFALCDLPGFNMILSGGSKGISAFRTGTFTRAALPVKISNDIIGIASETHEADSSVVWLGTRYEGVIRMILREQEISADLFTTADGLPEGPVTPFLNDSQTVFATGNGLFSFTPENVVRESLPDSLKNDPDLARGFFSTTILPGDSTRRDISWLARSENRLWICSANRISFVVNGRNTAVTRPFSGIEAGKINVLYPENGTCWFGTSEGLIRFDENNVKRYDLDFSCLVRKVKPVYSDTVFFSGTAFDPDMGIVPDQPASSRPVISYMNNSVRLEYSAPFFEYPSLITYSTRLNSDAPWSEWKKENYHEYENLREGRYTFTVKARNAYGTESTAAVYSFVILPPWYRSVTAYVMYVIGGILLVWLIAWFYSYRLKVENIRLEGIVAERTSEIAKKNAVLEFQKKEIEDSIRYASRIQSAVIPSERECSELLPESFVFFRPLNIVSGDFYWTSRIGSKIIFATADCTGHGVPGAFMSMLGVAFLNEIVNRDMITEPDLILDHLRKKVISALQHKGMTGETRDGMDIALVSIDTENKYLHFAGALNPLIMIRNNQVKDFPADKMPIGFYERMDPFTRHEVRLEKGDVFYMCSDGYEDQFGGPDGKKFKARKFRQMLLEIHGNPMKEQKEIIEKRFTEWKGELEQVDDVVVTGIAFR